MELEIEKKPKVEYVNNIKVNCPKSVYNLKEVQEIKDAVQEHLLFIGADRCNNLRKVIVTAIGTSSGINVDVKDIVRNALVNACDRVILVHNHPSNSIIPTAPDKKVTCLTNELLKVFNIELLDHIIVTENEYCSLKEMGYINDYIDEKKEILDKVELLNENKRLKEKIKKLERNNSKELER